jgi:hypothetical protein
VELSPATEVDVTIEAAIEHQKRHEWAQAKALWELRDLEDRSLLQDINIAICCTWLQEGDEALARLDRHLPWLGTPVEFAGSSEESLKRLRRALFAVDLYASDLEGDSDRISSTAEALASLGGRSWEMVRTPIAVVSYGEEIDVLEDVVNIGDLLIPLTLNCGRLRHSPSERAQRLSDLYSILKRDDLEPLTTQRARLESVIGLPGIDHPHFFSPTEWQAREPDEPVKIQSPQVGGNERQPQAPEGLMEDMWVGFHDQLAGAFQELTDELKRPERVETPTEYAHLYGLVKEFASYLPVCTALIPEGTGLYRARVTHDAVGRERDLSYVPDPNWVRDFGRTNAPEESIFYCANDARTAVAEVLSDWFQESEEEEDIRRVFVGRWIVTKSIPVAVVPYHEEAMALSPSGEETRRQMQILRRQFKPKTWALIERCQRFLGSEYARPATNALDYWVSCAYFNCVTNPRNFLPQTVTPLGLSYPSVQMKFSGDNFATLPSVVNTSMYLVDAQALRFRRTRGGRFAMEGSAPRWFSKVRREFGF